MRYKIFEYDPMLLPYERDINQRMLNYENKRRELVGDSGCLRDFANGHEYFGFHRANGGWYYREWAPSADEVFITGDMNGWDRYRHRLTPIGNGVFEIFLPGENAFYDGCYVKTIVRNGEKIMERIPLYIRRVMQDPDNFTWCGVISDEPQYQWKKKKFTPKKELCIYECHIGMAQEKEGIGTYTEFRDNILPRIKDLGYNNIQIMAIMEHPYYGSFGYQVSSFFAASSKYGTPNELKSLVDKAHEMGIAVLLDVVHSHAVRNTAEGINEFDGTVYQFFHEGERGEHPTWGTKLFNYNKNEVIHFLLSNLKFWMEEYHFDGFRFDGVTSMIYHDHGLGTAFTDYSKYFSLNTDTEAITYLQLAAALIKEVNPNAIAIAEDMSAMPGMCLPIEEGGIGFDYRLAMGLPDMWIKLLKEQRDESWNMFHIWHELTSRRPMEKYIGYVESHDQALVGDKTVMFRLCDSYMYTHMSRFTQSPVIDRGMALHKLIRMVTMTLGGEGYLNFMGNEFGHPEWIDFPRVGNGWSYFYCRRQWHLADDTNLRYEYLNNFDREMIHFLTDKRIYRKNARCVFIDEYKQVMVYERNGLTFVVNFSPVNSYEQYYVEVPAKGDYRVVLSTDEKRFDGYDRISKDYIYKAEMHPDGKWKLPIYMPSRSGLCLARVKKNK
ncbi:MAG: alpha amylase C-terminal domain-containing protein [Clostridia bacterium]|nr:alpha amylase C-terminal domain-containing protein [Clostridia bacterium]